MTVQPTFSIMIPTIGRAMLDRVLGQLAPQTADGDEILVVGDGRQPEAQEMASRHGGRVKYMEHGPDHCWGHPQRNWAMPLARGSHLMSMDDDDESLPGALSAVRAAVAAAPDSVHAFRIHHKGGLIWAERAVYMGNLSTQNFVVPNVPARLGRWGRRYEGDFDFIRSTLDLHPDGDATVVWHEDIVAVHGEAPR